MARILITSALPYINGIKHLGNLVGSQLPADLYARYCRARGHEVLFLCATDEHGTPAELAAAKTGEDVAEYCQRMHGVQSRLAEGFRLSFDKYGRSSSLQNHALTQHLAGKLYEAELIEERAEKQVYSVADGRFLPDRYIEGTCPNCGYERARGDQCENCTKQLDPTDLIDPRSAISGSTDLEVRETKHLYLLQSKMRDELRRWILSKTRPTSLTVEGTPVATNPEDYWPVLASSIALKWLNEGDGLQDRGITRDLFWGIPVKRGTQPWPGMEGKVFYVWFDAPIEYIACAAEWAEEKGFPDADWERWWRTERGADDVRYVQFMGKDNVPFHTLSFPVTLIGSGEDWKLVDYIKAFNYLNYDGGQFSTSQGRGVFMDDALELLPADYWRWWLLSHAPESGDSEFTWENFQSSVNKDLADVLGNFVSRVTKFCRAKWGEVVPEGGVDAASDPNSPDDAGHWAVQTLQQHLDSYERALDGIEVRKAAQELRSIWVVCNKYVQDAAPWSAYKVSPDEAAATVRLSLNMMLLVAELSEPFLPDAAQSLRKTLHVESLDWPRPAIAGERSRTNSVLEALVRLEAGHPISVPDVLFRKITDDERDAWQTRFAGVRT